jgi:hypothetical protein
VWYPVEKEKQQRYTTCGTLLKKKKNILKETSTVTPFRSQYSVIVVRGNGVIHRGQKPASRG